MKLQNAFPNLHGRHVVCFTRYEAVGPSSRLRFHQFQRPLEQAGCRVSFYPLLSERYLERFYGGKKKDKFDIAFSYVRRLAQLATLRADLVWVEKELFPFLPGMFERMLRSRAVPYVVDFDDAIFHNYDLRKKGFVRSLLESKLDPLLSGCAMVTAGNSYLADYAQSHGAPSVAIIPTVVDTRRYPARPPIDRGRIRVGWIGTRTNERYLAPVIRALTRLSESLPLTLVTVGASRLSGLAVPQEQHEWTEDTEGELVASFDIGVMPLADTPWERGKCGYKLIQYMAAARPVIASSVGVNSEIVTPDVGRLVHGEADWERAIHELGTSRELMTRLGANGRRRVEEYYSLDAAAPQLLNLFDKVLAAPVWHG
ncbi:glycosyltransferase family 4 protein [Altererythrobacter sp. TH136]|uniref:glycosyltransferase family 4 protein n=1 Tax=Altererythrobacter sp. TH136 TaxID=2067415 RepID=UPI001162A818|nr:glycosyltransferase family 4 protein [Altererythrobacter sp. TH136]QDM41025.1 glycosyltransferase family 4 protein [Altererythrobacter sp. TH136]